MVKTVAMFIFIGSTSENTLCYFPFKEPYRQYINIKNHIDNHISILKND